MKVLTLTTLFPNQQQPVHAVFVKNRIAAFSKLCEVKVVAPVPCAFPFRFFSKKYRLFAKVPYTETQGSMEVLHPRYLVTPKLGRNFYGFMYFFSILGFIMRLRKGYNFDLLDVHWAYPDGFAGVLLGKFFNKPVTITIRGSDLNYFTKFFFRRKMIAYALKRANKVITVCEDMVDRVSKLGVEKSKIEVVPNGVDLSKFYPLAEEHGHRANGNDKIYARERLGLPKERRIILSVGRLGYPKRVDHIIEAVNILIKKRKGSKERETLLLIILGDGEYREKLKNQVDVLGLSEYVKLVGSRPNEELIYWYNAADIFCLASSSEGWPNVIFESLACGTPVIASAVGGVPEILHSEEYGILVREQDPMILAQALYDALNKTWDTGKILKYVRRNTWDSVAQKVYSTFQPIVK